MIKIRLQPGKYYEAVAWLMTNHKTMKWGSDPLNHIITLPNTKEALIISMKFS